MPIKYGYDSSLKIVDTRPYGELSLNEVIMYYMEILNDDLVKNNIIEVIHFEDVKNFHFSSNEASDIAIAYNDMKENKGVIATIFIGISDMHFGMARMMQTLFEMNVKEHLTYSVRSEEEAKKIIKNTIG